MSEIAIRAEGLSKRYRIGQRERYHTLRETLVDAVKAPLRALWLDGKSLPDSELWALNDVSFEVRQGEVLGIIGRNGAGKTTLLKILSRITPPTAGYADIRGRVGSLLEVGTGFHPELTGRENIFLSGAILGMKKAEIEHKFDEIVSFAEVERFIDTPVKHYSSGMYVRLAFAVAAHFEPEILLVDEVLAVGDIEFQKKCLGRMERTAKEGRTVLVVSHSMSTVKALCSKAILLDSGTIKAEGAVDGVVAEYLGAHRTDPTEKFLTDQDHDSEGGKAIRVKRITLLNGALNSFSVYWKQPVSVSLEIEVFEDVEEVSFGVALRTLDGSFVFVVYNDDDGRARWDLLRGHYQVQFTVKNNLRPGLYTLHVGGYQRYARLKNLFAVDAVKLEVLDFTEGGFVPSIADPGLVGGIESSFSYKELARGEAENR